MGQSFYSTISDPWFYWNFESALNLQFSDIWHAQFQNFPNFFLDFRHAHIWINRPFSDLCSTKLATTPLPAYYISVLDHLWRYFNNSGLLWWFWNSFKQHFLSLWPSDPSFGPIWPVFGLWRHLKGWILTTLVTATLQLVSTTHWGYLGGISRPLCLMIQVFVFLVIFLVFSTSYMR